VCLCAASSADGWPMYRHDAAHTGCSNTTVPTALPKQLWNCTLEPEPVSFPNSPTVTDSFVFVKSADHLSCFDAFTGAKLWSFPVVSYTNSAPAIVDGQVYVGSVDGIIYSLDVSNGLQVSTFVTDDLFDLSPTVVDGFVYVESSRGDVYCFDAKSCFKLWNFSTGAADTSSSPAVTGGYVYVSNDDGNVFCLNASNGAVIWSVVVDGALGSPTFSDGSVYFGSSDGNVYCLNASDGAKVWNYTTEYNNNGPSHNYHWGNKVSDTAVAYGKIYVGSSDFLIYCLDASLGNQIWNYTTEAEVYSAPSVAGGCVLVGSYDGNLYCLNATSGSEIWRYPVGVFSPVNAAGSAGSPALAGGTIYVVGNGVIYALAASSHASSFQINVNTTVVVAVLVIASATVYVALTKRKAGSP